LQKHAAQLLQISGSTRSGPQHRTIHHFCQKSTGPVTINDSSPALEKRAGYDFAGANANPPFEKLEHSLFCYFPLGGSRMVRRVVPFFCRAIRTPDTF
jgi:hypothetical protein